VLREDRRIALAFDNRAHDLHAGDSGDICDDVMKLDVHLHHGLLHVLHVCRR
jgi:hypothetical protein